MKYVSQTICLLFLLISLYAMGQDKVNGSIQSTDTAELKILNVYPDSFPEVSVVFKAEKRNGEPVWNLSKEKMKVQENGQNCTVISLEQISKNKPINIGIVIDHSGSMLYDMKQLYKGSNDDVLYSFDSNMNPIFPKGYVAPIDRAKSAVNNFVSSFNFQKDLISVIGFSTNIDKRLPLSRDTTAIHAIINSMKADSSTALYDAMIAGLEQVYSAEGIKVLVVLTDGMDNASWAKWKDVVDMANKKEIPIYIIGLGDANVELLGKISKSTNGEFYFAQSSNSLDTIYAAISKKVQAFYDLVYSSPNMALADTSRQLEIRFDVDSIYLISNPATLKIPEEIMRHIAQKEKQREYIIGGSIGLAALMAVGLLVFYRRRKQKNNAVLITNLYPNPASGNITLEFENAEGNLVIMDMSGKILLTVYSVNVPKMDLDISELENGNYIAMIQADAATSNGKEFIVRH